MNLVNNALSCIKNEAREIIFHIRNDLTIYVLMAIFVICVSGFVHFHGYVNDVRFFAYFYILKFVVPISIVLYFIYYFFELLFKREKRPLRCYLQRIKLVFVYRAKLVSAFILLTAMSVFISSFSTMKSLIPIVNMFHFDELFHQLDLLLFNGHQPGLLVVESLANPFYLFVINFCYNLWFFFIWAILAYFLVADKSTNRTTFLISWILCWGVLGAVLAMLLSSAGPVFVEKLDPTNLTYQPLMQLLQEKHAWLVEQGWPGLYSLSTQEQLWLAYAENVEMLGSGISAMPSMHVSIAVLMALSMGAVNKFISYFLWFFAALIFIGSFTLGWHYAVDGLVSAPLTYLIWRVSLAFAERSSAMKYRAVSENYL